MVHACNPRTQEAEEGVLGIKTLNENLSRETKTGLVRWLGRQRHFPVRLMTWV